MKPSDTHPEPPVNRELYPYTGLEIAVIGLSGAFPGAVDVPRFWENLQQGREGITFFHEQQLLEAGAEAAEVQQPSFIKAKGILADIHHFDADFFGYAPREVEVMDPQVRLFYQHTWHALEDAGYDPGTYAGLIGLYAGARSSFAWEARTLVSGLNSAVGDFAASILNDKDYLSARMAYKFNLRGPCYTLQTACSTSLVAIHLGCQGLLSAECDIALAGGISLGISQRHGYRYHEGMIFSPDGHCRTFDASANGTFFGEGVGIVVLKRLQDAITDGDCIYALIKGSACNNDGVDRIGFTAPGIAGQTAVIRAALSMAEVDPETIGYVEAHGTATRLGDPIEIEALTRAYSTEKRHYCAIGSVKSNLGHLNTAAGVSGFIKTVLSLHHRLIPPSLHFENPNPEIDFDHSPFYVNTRLQPWPSRPYPRRAGVSSFGIGGTNAHVILEEYSPAPPAESHTPSTPPRPLQLLFLSARTPAALDRATQNLHQYLQDHHSQPDFNLEAVAYTLAVGRKVFPHRRFCSCGSAAEALDILADPLSPKIKNNVCSQVDRPVVFMFPGQGSQYVAMGRELYWAEPRFRQELDRCFQLMVPLLGVDIQALLYPPDAVDPAAASRQLAQTAFAQPLLFAFEYALAQWLLHYGITPAAMMGHSIGEYVAACLAGVFTLEQALQLVCARGQCMQSMPSGAMLGVSQTPAQLLPLLQAHPDISLAAINAPHLCVLAGPHEAVAALAVPFQEQGVACRLLHTSHAFHSSMMDPILPQFENTVRAIIQQHKENSRTLRFPFISNLTGTWITPAEAFSPPYWVQHLRQSVRFADGLSTLLATENYIYLEVGPGRSLSTFVKKHPAIPAGQAVIHLLPAALEKSSDHGFFLERIGALWLLGISLHWPHFYAGRPVQRTPLPGYPFEPREFPINTRPLHLDSARSRTQADAPQAEMAHWFYVPRWLRAPLPLSPTPAVATAPDLIFADTQGLSDSLLAALQEQAQHVIVVQAGARFATLSNSPTRSSYTLSPQQPEDYVALWAELQQQDRVPRRILHLQGVTGPACGHSFADLFYSIFYLVQAIGQSSHHHPLQFTLLTDGMQAVLGDDILYPEKATLLGLLEVIPAEYPHITCQSIDVVLPQSGTLPRLVENILQEINQTRGDNVVAYRGPFRWVRTFESQPLAQEVLPFTRLRPHGVVLITGGVGGIGLELAAFLAKTAPMHFILTRRTPFPHPSQWSTWLDSASPEDPSRHAIQRLLEIQALGSTVTVASVDVTDQEAMAQLIATSVAQWGPITGVIHAAGVADAGLLQLKNPRAIAPILAPKITGTWVLDRLLLTSPMAANLDFVFLCSSTRAIVAPAGQAIYAAANAFLDAFALYKNRENRTLVTAINWDAWLAVGMAATFAKPAPARASAPTSPPHREPLASQFQPCHHVLFKRQAQDPAGFEWYAGELHMDQWWFLTEHRIDNQGIVPATAYIDMIVSLFSQRCPHHPLQIENIVFLSPLVVPPHTGIQLHLLLEKLGRGEPCVHPAPLHFRFFSRPLHGSDTWQEHCSGAIHIPAETPPHPLDIPALKAQCALISIPAERLRLPEDKQQGLIYGPRWDNKKSVSFGAQQGLAHLELPTPYLEDLHTHPLHPALLDMATAFPLLNVPHTTPYFPFSYQKILVRGPLPATFYSYARTSDQTTDHTLRFDITLLDEAGFPVVEIEAFTLIKISQGRVQRFQNSASPSQVGLLPAQAVAAFARILAVSPPLPQVVVSPRDVSAVLRTGATPPESPAEPPVPRTYDRPPLSTAYVSPQHPLEQTIAHIWQRFFGFETIGIHDDFFELGGDSLKVTTIISQLHKQLHKEIPLVEFFNHPTIAQLAEFMQGAASKTFLAIRPVEKKEYYPLSSAQERLFVVQRMNLDSIAYNTPLVVELSGPLDRERLDAAFTQMFQRHDSLRTSFELLDSQAAEGLPVQCLHPQVVFALEYYTVPPGAGHAVDIHYFLRHFVRVFDLSQAPLLRAGVLAVAEHQHILMLDIHHIIADFISVRLFLQELMALYEGRHLPALTIQYPDYAQWQNQLLRSPAIHQQETYWLAEFSRPIPPLDLPYDFPRPALQSFAGDTLEFKIGVAETQGIKERVRQKNVTLFMVLLAAYSLFLSRLSNCQEIVIGTPSAGRGHADLERVIGMFVNTLALLTFPSGAKTFHEFLQEIKERTLQTFENQDYPFETLVERVVTHRDLGRNPLFSVVFALQNIGTTAPLPDAPEPARVSPRITPLAFKSQIAKFDLSLAIAEENQQLQVIFEYSTALFKPETIHRFAGYFKTILAHVAQDTHALMGEMDILSPQEKEQLLVTFNQTQSSYPQDHTIHQWIAEQAQRTPDGIALIGPESGASDYTVAITYRELNHRACSVAIGLQQRAVGPDTIVAIMADRTVTIIIGIIAILNAGGAYLPIDPDYPQERIDFMLKDSAASILLRENGIQDGGADCQIRATTGDILGADCQIRATTGGCPYGCPDITDTAINSNVINPINPIHPINPTPITPTPISPTNLAYVIYTSGTTGKPKGVLISHRNVVRLLVNDRFQFDFGPSDVWTLFHSLCFDFSVWEMYGPLFYGGSMVIVPKKIARDPDQFVGLATQQQVTVLNQTPSAFYNFISSEAKNPQPLLSLRYVVFGGEALHPAQLTHWFARYPQTRLINMYGITETTVHVTFKEIQGTDITAGISNIGTPIPTLTTYCLDPHLQLCPIGVPGELCVGGLGVARGYLNRPEQTREKFIHPPIAFAPYTDTLYRSGDLVRFLASGQMEYLGRIDQQVKIRGFRIEPGEIETRLLSHPTIQDAFVLPHQDQQGDKYLCAYIVFHPAPHAQTSPDSPIATLRHYLSQYLPDYMIPAYFVPLEKIPLTANGKLDKAALPTPESTPGQHYIAPRNAGEEKLAAIWSTLLPGSSRWGIDDPFFSSGGDSIKAIRLIGAINQVFSNALKIVDIYTHGTIRQLAQLLQGEPSGDSLKTGLYTQVLARFEELKNRAHPRLTPPPGWVIQDIFPMTDIEKGIAVYYLKFAGTPASVYHDQFVYLLDYPQFHLERFIQAARLLMGQHGILRTAFNLEDFEEPVHVLYQTIPPPITHQNIAHLTASQQQSFIQSYLQTDRLDYFKSGAAPLWRMHLLSLDPTHQRLCLLFSVHHGILDGWSVASLLTELRHTYFTLQDNPSFVPTPLQATYKDTVIAEAVEKQDPALALFWKNELADYHRLEFSRTLDNKNNLAPMVVYFHDAGPQPLAQLEQLATTHHTTVKNLCFGIYLFLMGMFSPEKDVLVGCVTNNRPAQEDGDQVLGCFLNTVPVRLPIPAAITWCDYIALVETKMMEVKRYERLSLFEIALACGEKSRDNNPFFDTLFNFMNFHVLHQDEPVTAPLLGDEAHKKDRPFALQGQQDTNTLFDFEVNITHQHLLLCPKYNSAAITAPMVEKCCLYFLNILNLYQQNPHGLARLDAIMAAAEREELLFHFNDTATPYAREKTMFQLVEEQVARTPDWLALCGPSLQTLHTPPHHLHLSYHYLNQEANRLACALREKGMGPGSFVAVIMDRSVEMVLAVLAILKAGAAYVPMEPYLPELRLQTLLSSLAIPMVLTTPSSHDKVRGLSPNLPQLQHILCLQKEWMATWWHYPAENLNPAAHATDTAYVIFTSGSTGTPKGVVETHRPVINLIEWVNRTFQIGGPSPLGRLGDRLLFVASLGFDLSVYDMFGLLASGGALRVVAAAQFKDPVGMLEMIFREGITFWDSAPAALQQLVPFFADTHAHPRRSCLRLVFLSGDWIPVTMPDALKETFPGVAVISLGGATEATVWSNYYPIGEVDPRWVSIPYGKPIQNARYYILDRDLSPCPIGVPGDLYIGGQCLASEYKNDPHLTASKFIPNPFCQGEKMYKTGDMARWFADGNMEFLGRQDHQVKIRGFRIELGEIEAQLALHPAIADCIVLDRLDPSGHKTLCAYYVTKPSYQTPDNEQLKAHLAQTTPDYMIPSYFSPITAMPVTPHGKVDRRALPDPELPAQTGVLAAENAIQQTLLDIWTDILGLQPGSIGIDADFFQWGGHSLNATLVISRIHRDLGVKIPLADIFQCPQVRALAQRIAAASQVTYHPIPPTEKKDFYPLSSAQKRLYILHLLDQESLGYNESQAVVLEGELDLPRLSRTMAQLLERHESLRTAILLVAGEPVQRVHEPGEVQVKPEFFESADAGPAIQAIFRSFIRPFDLSQAPFLRLGLIKTAPDRHVLILDIHHIITDGLSHMIVIQEFLALYGGRELPTLRLQYRDYSQWLLSAPEQHRLQQQENYWLERLAGEIPVVELPYDFHRPAMQRYDGDTLTFDIPATQTLALRHMLRNMEVTPFIFFLAIFNILAARLSGEEDILVGVPVAGRGHLDLQGIIGMFVNTLVLRNHPTPNQSFSDFLKKVRHSSLEAFENQDYPFETLVEKIQVRRDTARNPLFDISFEFQNVASPALDMVNTGNTGLRFTPYPHAKGTSKFDLTLIGSQSPEGFHFVFEYSTPLFKPETIQRFRDYFITIINTLLRDPQMPLQNIDILPAGERHCLLDTFNHTTVSYLQDSFIPWFIAEHAARTPDRIAVMGPMGDGAQQRVSLTYRVLHQEASALAASLIERGVQPETIVAIQLERGVLMLIAITAIFQAGAAYLPLDPHYPPDRIDYILKDSGIKILLTEGASCPIRANTEDMLGASCQIRATTGDILGASCPIRANTGDMLGASCQIRATTGGCPYGCPDITYTAINSLVINPIHPINPTPINPTSPITPINPTNLAYVIYTSGTTGKPKGAMVEQMGMMNHIHAKIHDLHLDTDSIVVQNAAHTFDISVWQFLVALAVGGKTIIYPNELVLNPEAFVGQLVHDHVTILEVVPSYLSVLLDTNLFRQSQPLSLRYLVVTGEAINPHLVDRWFDHYPGIPMMNAYGPTEAADDITHYLIDKPVDQPQVPIGTPVRNMQIYIVDQSMNICPLGVKGEICVAGIGVGRGYLNQPELTAEKFIPNPFHSPLDPSPTLYHTGDVGKWLPNGFIVFSDRKDNQVKIRGHRIELEEIETVLLQYEPIQTTSVFVKDADYICSFFTATTEISATPLREYLATKLPDYMIPSFFMQIEKIPLTANGKVDKKALKAMEIKMNLDHEYVAPGDETQRLLVGAWQEVLKTERIGIHDSFFEIGGNSLKSVQVINKINEIFKSNIPLTALFRYPTVLALTGYLQDNTPALRQREATLKQGNEDKLQRLEMRKRRNK